MLLDICLFASTAATIYGIRVIPFQTLKTDQKSTNLINNGALIEGQKSVISIDVD